MNIPFKELARNDKDRILKFEIHKVTRKGKRTYLGEANFSIEQIKKKKKKFFYMYNVHDLVG